ncbi:unnamed protein product, partial [Musa acuminata subsp. burmannicoides]
SLISPDIPLGRRNATSSLSYSWRDRRGINHERAIVVLVRLTQNASARRQSKRLTDCILIEPRQYLSTPFIPRSSAHAVPLPSLWITSKPACNSLIPNFSRWP